MYVTMEKLAGLILTHVIITLILIISIADIMLYQCSPWNDTISL